jgi:hypothetical protein
MFGRQHPLRLLGWAALGATKAATLAYTAEAVIRPDQPKYKGKAMRIRALGYVAGLALVPAIWTAARREDPYPIEADLAMSVPLLIDAAGNSLGIYDEARLDDVVHGINAGVLTTLFGAAVSTIAPSREVAALSTLAFGLAGELLWDAMEYVGEAMGFKGMGLTPHDTIADMTIAGIGTAVGTAITWARWDESRRSEHARGSRGVSR